MGQLCRAFGSYNAQTISAISPVPEPQSLEGVGSWRWDPATGETVWSPDIFTLLGLPPEMGGASTSCWIAAVAPEDRERCLAAAERLKLTGEPFTLVFRVRVESGYRWLMSHGHVERCARGEVIAYAGTTADVTPLYGLIERALQDVVELADITGADDPEPDAAQRLTKKIRSALLAAVKTFFTVAGVCGL